MNVTTKILISIDWFLPGTNSGGPVRSIANMVANFPEIEFWIVTRNTDYLGDSPYSTVPSNSWHKHADNVMVYYFSQEQLNKANLTTVIKESGCQLIYINGIYSTFFSQIPLRISKQLGLKAIVAPRGMLSSQALKVKSLKKAAFIFWLNLTKAFKDTTFHVTSEQELKDVTTKISSFSNIITTLNLPRISRSQQSTISKSSKDVHFVYVGRISQEKGLLEGLKALHPIKESSLKLDIYGAIYDEKYWENCLAEIKELNTRFKINYKGIADSEDIPQIIQGAHFLFSPTTGENFGHAIVESLLNYRPVLITPNTPWQNLNKSLAGYDVSIDEFSSVIQQITDMNDATFQKYCVNAHAYIKKELNTDQTIEKYKLLFSVTNV